MLKKNFFNILYFNRDCKTLCSYFQFLFLSPNFHFKKLNKFNFRNFSVLRLKLNGVLNDHTESYPTSYLLTSGYIFGFLSGIMLVNQIVTGLFLLSVYDNTLTSFASVERIMRDVPNGWLFRYAHANGASFFFIVMYSHIFKNIKQRVFIEQNRAAWVSGILIFLLVMATSFLGYVLPWGQMSFWGATVITNLLSVIPVIGPDITILIWGGYSVQIDTVKRFLVLHYLLPLVILVLVLLHLYFIHLGSATTSGTGQKKDVYLVSFLSKLGLKDLSALFFFYFLFIYFIFYFPNILGHPDNYIEANPMVTPAHIVPEWYFLPFYAMLRAVPNKALGVVIMFGAILIFFCLPIIVYFRNFLVFNIYYFVLNFFKKFNIKKNFLSFFLESYFFKSLGIFIFGNYDLVFLFLTGLFAVNFVILGWLGAQTVEPFYVFMSLVSTIFYFFYLIYLFLVF